MNQNLNIPATNSNEFSNLTSKAQKIATPLVKLAKKLEKAHKLFGTKKHIRLGLMLALNIPRLWILEKKVQPKSNELSAHFAKQNPETSNLALHPLASKVFGRLSPEQSGLLISFLVEETGLTPKHIRALAGKTESEHARCARTLMAAFPKNFSDKTMSSAVEIYSQHIEQARGKICEHQSFKDFAKDWKNYEKSNFHNTRPNPYNYTMSEDLFKI